MLQPLRPQALATKARSCSLFDDRLYMDNCGKAIGHEVVVTFGGLGEPGWRSWSSQQPLERSAPSQSMAKTCS